MEFAQIDDMNLPQGVRQRLSNYKSHEQQWALTELRKGENIESIIDGLKYYNNKIKDNRYQQIMKPIANPINPKSLTQITLQQIKTGQQQYDAKYGGVSKRGAKRKAKETKHEYASILINEQDLKVIKIEKTDDTNGAAEAAREITKGTKWCVSCIKTGNGYLKLGPLYYIEYDNYKYLCHVESEQLMDAADQPYKIDIELYHRLVKCIKGIGIFLKDRTSPENIARFEDAIKYSPRLACDHARYALGGRWPEAEPCIVRNADYAYEYACHVINGRWPEAEPNIMEYTDYAYIYATDVIKGRWPEAEPIIMKDVEYAYRYARYILNGRWPEAEPIIIQDPHYACRYAINVIKGRWPEAEPIIMKKPNLALDYAKDVINGRWPEAEPTIMKEPSIAFNYAKYVIKGRWPEAEPTIMQNPEWAYYYTRYVIKGRWLEAEPIIMKEPNIAFNYAKYVINGRWPEAQPQ